MDSPSPSSLSARIWDLPRRAVECKKTGSAPKGTPTIDKTMPLNETAKAMRYLEAGHVRGKIVITVAE